MARVSVTLSPTDIRVVPGATATLVVDIANAGSVVERYRCEVVGIDPSWWRVTPEDLELFPEHGPTGTHAPPSRGRFTVTFQVPRTPAATAGSWPIGIRVHGESDPSASVEEARLAIQPFESINAQLHPRVARGRWWAAVEVRITNEGNHPEHLQIAGSDPSDLLVFEIAPPVVDVEPGATVPVKVRMSRGLPSLAGVGETRPFTLTIGSTADPDAVQVAGAFEKVSLIPAGPATILIGVACLVVAASAIATIYLGSSGPSRSPGPGAASPPVESGPPIPVPSASADAGAASPPGSGPAVPAQTLPTPALEFVRADPDTRGFHNYVLSVSNRGDFAPDWFAPDETLRSCDDGSVSSRIEVWLLDAATDRSYTGWCAIRSAVELGDLHMDVPIAAGVTRIVLTMTDVRTGTVVRSNEVEVP